MHNIYFTDYISAPSHFSLFSSLIKVLQYSHSLLPKDKNVVVSGVCSPPQYKENLKGMLTPTTLHWGQDEEP